MSFLTVRRNGELEVVNDGEYPSMNFAASKYCCFLSELIFTMVYNRLISIAKRQPRWTIRHLLVRGDLPAQNDSVCTSGREITESFILC